MKFSVITVNFNNSGDLSRTIDSVKGQTFNDFEYVIIDGGSTDDSLDVIRKNQDSIDYWVSERDKGIYDGMNKGIAAAKGDYCIFLNSGDTFFSESTLQEVAPLLSADIVCGNAKLTNGQDYLWTAPDSVDEVFWRQRNSVCHQSLFIRTVLLKEHPYDSSLKIVADYKAMFYETVVNGSSYKHIDVTICNYGCDGVSSDHVKSDMEKQLVIDDFVRAGYIQEDRLVACAKRLKVGSRRYKLAFWLLSRL